MGVIVLALNALTLAAQTEDRPPEPARLLDGSVPGMTPFTTAGGNVVLTVAVSSSGQVGGVEVLRTTPPFTEPLVDAVRAWRFSPALDGKQRPIDSQVLVASLIRPPDLYLQAVGTPPKDVRAADPRVAFPTLMPTPRYAIDAHAGGTVLVEVGVDRSGHVAAAAAVKSCPPFDTIALDSARSWTFRPAEGPDLPPMTFAYLLFVFRAPVVGAGSPGSAAWAK